MLRQYAGGRKPLRGNLRLCRFPAHRLLRLLVLSAALLNPSEAWDVGGLGVRLTRHEAGSSSSSSTCSTSDNV
jgi:hypothetical protein